MQKSNAWNRHFSVIWAWTSLAVIGSSISQSTPFEKKWKYCDAEPIFEASTILMWPSKSVKTTFLDISFDWWSACFSNMNVEKKLDSTFLLNIGKYQGHEFANSYLTFLLLSVSKSFSFNYDWVAQFEIVKLLCPTFVQKWNLILTTWHCRASIR